MLDVWFQEFAGDYLLHAVPLDAIDVSRCCMGNELFLWDGTLTLCLLVGLCALCSRVCDCCFGHQVWTYPFWLGHTC